MGIDSLPKSYDKDKWIVDKEDEDNDSYKYIDRMYGGLFGYQSLQQKDGTTYEGKFYHKRRLLKSELEIEKNKFNLIVAAQKEEIETLRNLAKGSDSTLWATIGFALGTASSIAIFYAATEIAK